MLITRCSECFTAFRITQAQIEARKGMVRCGRCQAVFDALASLRDEEEDLASAGDAQSPPGNVSIATESRTPADDVLPQADRSGLAAPAEDALPPADRVALPEAPPTAQKAERAAAAVAAAAQSERAPVKAPAWIQPAARISPPSETEIESSPAPIRGRRLGWLASSLLLLALLGQIAFHNRGEIALLVPQFEPSMKALCQTIGCEVPLPRRAELMSIESSDLRADTTNPAVMVLTATLRNRAAFPQSLPALELTLTDVRDQALARRVLSANEYLGERAGNRFPANSELPAKVFVDAASLGAAGYRLYLFFP